jgi:hypothetical protein
VIADRLPPEVSRCVLQHLPDNEMRAEVLDDPRAWNLGRARAEDAVDGLGLTAMQNAVLGGELAADDECAGVWAAFAE